MTKQLGRTWISALAVCAAVSILVACSSGEGEPGGGTPGASGADGTSSEESQGSALEKITADGMCGLLAAESVAQHLDVEVEETEGKERGRAPVMRSPYFLTRECKYDTTEIGYLTTDLTTEWDEDDTDQQVLDGVFTDRSKESEPVGDYDPVSGLGVLAGFGADPLLSQAEVAAQKLGVVLRIGEERLLLTVSWSLGNAEVAQLRPLAEELLKNLETAR